MESSPAHPPRQTVLVVDEELNVAARGYCEFPQIYPQPGWVEHDPLEIWRTQIATARDALAKAGIAANAVRAVDRKSVV